MRLWSKRLTLATAGVAVGLVAGFTLSDRAQAQAPATPKSAPAPAAPGTGKAGTYFKNVNTSTLKELTPDDFLSAMGVMADSLGLDCADCHPGAGTDKVDWVFDTPAKKTARKMVEMVANINKTNFAGAQSVTCYTCHHARDRPATTISLDSLYSVPNQERDDMVKADPAQPSATSILDKYIAALGGQQKLNTLTSYILNGESIGYEGLGGNGTFTVYAKAPDEKTTMISFKEHPERGTSSWTFNGKTGWMQVPRGLLGEYELSGGNLDGARLEAQLGFPGQIKTLFTNWRTGSMESIGEGADSKDYLVVQGSRGVGAAQTVVTLFFDAKTNLLFRMIRYTASPIGKVPTQIDYNDYRDVNGIKFPFDYQFLWLDGRFNAKLTGVQINPTIDQAKFGKP
jgi:photosynthetic reaction center cytochrome c subunit